MIETGNMAKLLEIKDFVQFVIQTKLKMKFTFSSTVRNIQLLEMIYFQQKQSYFKYPIGPSD